MRFPLTRKLLTSGIALSMLAISLSGVYRLTEPSGVTWDVVLMLTPSGILDNLVLNPGMPLAPFYFDPAVRDGVLEHPWLWIFLTLNWALGLTWFIRRRRGLS